MINPFADVKWKPDLVERRKFAKSLMVGFPCLALIFLIIGWIAKGHWDANLTFSVWLGACGGLAGLIFFAVPQISRPAYVVWYFLACCVGIIVGNLLLGGFYYLIYTPIGLIVRRLAGKPILRKNFDKRTTTYWKDVPPINDPRKYYRQF